MPSQAIIVGGGIQAGSPFTLGSLTRIVNTDPPTIADSIAVQRTQGGTQVLTVGLVSATDWPLANTYTERLQTVGGFISDTGAANDNVLIGRGAAALIAADARNVVIGRLAKANGGPASSENVVIGYNIDLSARDIGSAVIIGAGNVVGASFPAATTIVGANNTANNAFAGPGIGTGSSWQGSGVGIGNQQAISAVNNWVGVGRSVHVDATGQTVVGDNARGQAGHDNSITLGRNALSIAANSVTVGALNVGITTVLIGEGDTVAAPANVLHRHTDASGADAQGGIVRIRASIGTGNAATQGRISFQVGTPGASGSTPQTPTTTLQIRPPSTNGASVNFIGTSGAGAAAGTLLNAPTAGNPTDWIPVLFNGNVRYLPAWT